MKWLILLLLSLIPFVGCVFLYRAYRIHFKSDYSSIKDGYGVAPENPETFAPLLSRGYFLAGFGILASVLFITKIPLTDIAKIDGVIGLGLRAYMYSMLKK